MSETQAIIKQVDHIAIRTSDPEYLFHILTDVLQLPIVWPMKYYGLALSGVVCAGNANIEVFHYGSPERSSDSDEIETDLYSIAFEPTSLRDSISELSSRNIPHSPPIPYHGTRFDGYTGKLWTNVGLGGLLDGGSSSINVMGGFSQYPFLSEIIGKLIGRFVCMRWTESFVQAASGNSALYLTEYTHDISEIRSKGANSLMGNDGGLIGLEAVLEVILGVSDYENQSARWQQLFNPVLPSEGGVWRLAPGPAIRLSPNSKDRIKAILLKVRSLDNAERHLATFDLLGKTADQQVSISIPGIQNLGIHLVE